MKNNLITQIKECKSKVEVQRLVLVFKEFPNGIAELISLMNKDDLKLSEKSSWVLTHLIQQNSISSDDLKCLILLIEQYWYFQPIQRNLFRALQYVDIPVGYQSVLFDLSLKRMQEDKSDVAVRVFSMVVAYNIAVIHFELRQELIHIITLLEDKISPAFSNRARKLIQKLHF